MKRFIEPENESAYDWRCDRCRKIKGEAKDPKMKETETRADTLTRKHEEGERLLDEQEPVIKKEVGAFRVMLNRNWKGLPRRNPESYHHSNLNDGEDRLISTRLNNHRPTVSKEESNSILKKKASGSNIDNSLQKVEKDYLTDKISLTYLRHNPKDIVDLVIRKLQKMEFGDSVATGVINYAHFTLLATLTKMKYTQGMHREDPQDDTYKSNYGTTQEYTGLGGTVKRTCRQKGLSIEKTCTDGEYVAEILLKLDNSSDESPQYTFTSLTWELLQNRLLTNPYFNLKGRKNGMQGDQIIIRMLYEDFAEPSFLWELTRRVVSRITTQGYTAIGATSSAVPMNLRLPRAESCETRKPEKTDVPMAPRDANWTKHSSLKGKR